MLAGNMWPVLQVWEPSGLTELQKWDLHGPSWMSFCLFVFNLVYFFLTLLDLPCCLQTLDAVNGGYSPTQGAGFSFQWLLVLRNTGSGAPGLSGCGAWA